VRQVGFVIVDQRSNQFFAGYKHPGTQKTGAPVFVQNLENANFDREKASIWAGEKQAQDTADYLNLSMGAGVCKVCSVYVQL
jgi:hypothetical protein